MKTQFHITPTQRRRFRLMLFILVVLALLWFFQCEGTDSQANDITPPTNTEQVDDSKKGNHKKRSNGTQGGGNIQHQKAQKPITKANRATSRSHQTSRKHGKATTRLKIVKSGKLNHDKRHKIGQDIIEAKTIYIMVRNMVDITGEALRYPLWHEQVNYLTKEGTYSLLDYHKRFRQTNMRLIPEAKYHDSLPAPHLIVEIYLTEFSLAHGKKQKFPEIYWAETDSGDMLFTDLTWWQRYKKVTLTAEFRLLDYNCNLIIARPEKAGFIHDLTWTDYDGDRRILSREAANRNWQPYTPLREDEYVVMKGLKELITQTLARTAAFLDPLARRRAKINVPDYSGTL